MILIEKGRCLFELRYGVRPREYVQDNPILQENQYEFPDNSPENLLLPTFKIAGLHPWKRDLSPGYKALECSGQPKITSGQVVRLWFC